MFVSDGGEDLPPATAAAVAAPAGSFWSQIRTELHFQGYFRMRGNTTGTQELKYDLFLPTDVQSPQNGHAAPLSTLNLASMSVG
jgi:hypothetical protein